MSESAETERQFSTGADEAHAAAAVASREAPDLDFQGALAALREGIDGYGDRIHAGAAVLRATDDLAVLNSC